MDITPEDVATAGAAFGFLLDQYLEDKLPEDPASAYVRGMVSRRHGPRAVREATVEVEKPRSIAVKPAAKAVLPPPIGFGGRPPGREARAGQHARCQVYRQGEGAAV